MKINEKENLEKTEIEKWKEENGKIFKSIINDKDYIWRRLKRKEYSEVMAIKDGGDVDERVYSRQVAITKIAVLNLSEEELEKDLEELAGLATTLSEEVMDKSGFNLTATFEL